MSKLSHCLWYDGRAEEAAQFYVSIFPNSRIGRISRYTSAGKEIHGQPEGAVMVVEFELDGERYQALNGGPLFRFNEAFSIVVSCETQAEIDHYWSRLSDGGEEGPCGWLKDRFGLSWQVVPTVLAAMVADPDVEKARRVNEAFLKMGKFDLAALRRAYEGT